MNFGMIGAIGGTGQGLLDQGQFLAKQEDEDRAMARTQSLEDWKMRKQQEYKIQDEQRADTREIAKEDRGEQRTIRSEQRTDQRTEQQKDRDFNRLQAEAPTRRDIKVGDEKASAQGKIDVTHDNIDTVTSDEAAQAEAKQTQADKDLKAAQADYYRDRNDTSTSNAALRAGGKGGTPKVDPADAQELKDVQASIKEKRSMIDRGRIEGSWNDDALTPGQKKIQADLVTEQKRLQAILARNRAAGGDAASAPAADPLGLRKGAKTQLPNGTDDGNDNSPAGILGNEYRKAKIRLTAAVLPEEKERAQSDIAALQREAKAKGITLNDAAPAPAPAPAMVGPAPTPAVAPAAPAAPLDAAKTPPATAPAAAPAPSGSPQQALQQLGAQPGGAPAAGADTASKVEKLKQRASGAAAAPAVDPLMQALGATGSSSAASIVGEQAPALRAAAAKVKAAQAQVTAAAQSGNQQGVAQAMAQVQAAAAQLDVMLKDWNPAQAQAVKKALGVV